VRGFKREISVHHSWEPTYSLAYGQVFVSDTIRNSPSPPLANIVHFGTLHITITLTVLKRVC